MKCMVDGCDKLPTKGGIIQSYKTHETGFGSGSFSSTYCVELCEEHWNQQQQQHGRISKNKDNMVEISEFKLRTIEDSMLLDRINYGCQLKGMTRFLWFWFKTPRFFWSAGYKAAMNSVNSKIRMASEKDKILKIEL